MPSTIKISIVGALTFLFAELTLRWWARANIEAGSTIPLFSDFYLANAKHENSIMAFGLSSQAWLLIALAISVVLVLAFVFLLQIPQLSQGFAALGAFSAFLLLSVVVANLLEASLLGGVTDYLAIVDVSAGRATVVNFGDFMLFASMAVIVVSAIGAGISLVLEMAKVA